MSRFVKKIVLFVLILYVVDRAIGLCVISLEREIPIEREDEYIVKNVNSDIIVLGSSRAFRHYDTRVITDSLHVTCFNCGQSGQGIIHNYTVLSSIMKRHTPKLIIYDIYPPADFLVGDNMRYIKPLRPIKDNTEILKTLLRIDENERYKISSYMYCYNNVINDKIKNRLSLFSETESYNGFVPTKKSFLESSVNNKMNYSFGTEVHIDTIKMAFANDLVQLAKSSELIFIMSPFWFRIDDRYVSVVDSFAKANNILFYNFAADSNYVHNDNLFYDGVHLNAKGAEMFTKDVIKVINNI